MTNHEAETPFGGVAMPRRAVIIQFPGRRDTAPSSASPVDPLPQAIVDAFLDDLRVAGRQPRTIEGHEYELGRFRTWLATQQLDYRTAAPVHLSAYARTRAHLSPSSRAALAVTAHKFFSWAATEGHVAQSPASHLDTPPRPKAVPKALSVKQVRALLEHLDAHAPDGLRELRDRALLLTGLYTGMRASELADLVWGKLDLIERVVTITIAKMNKGRSVRMHPDLPSILGVWCDAQGLKGDHDAPVFSLDRKEKKAIVANRVGKVARHYAKLLDIPLTAHTLRHTFATWSLRRSGNIYSVSKALGHARLAQTEIYLRSDPSDSDDAVGSMPGLGDW